MQTIELTQILEGLGRTSLQAAILVLVVLAIQWGLGQRLSPRWRSALWLLVVARLLLPFSFATAVSIFNLLPGWKGDHAPPRLELSRVETPSPALPVVAPVSSAPLPVIPVQPAPGQPAPTPTRMADLPVKLATPEQPSLAALPPTPPRQNRLTWPWLMGAVWACGVLGFGVHVAVSILRLQRRYAHAPALSEPRLLEILHSCQAQMRVRTSLRLVEHAKISAPALFGLVRPRLLLPKGFAANFSERELRFIFLHELAHLKRRDLLLNWIVTILQIIHWFNPLLWLGFYRWRADRELACDALALEAAGPEQNEEYGRTILRLLEGLTRGTVAPGLVGLLEDKHQLRRRLSMIMEFKPARRAGLVSMVLLAVLGVVCLTDAQAPKLTPKAAQEKKAAAAKTASTKEAPGVRVGADPIDPANTNRQTHTLTLTVVDATTGQPLENAEVSVPYVDDWKQPMPRRLTDAQGRYVLHVPLVPEEDRAKIAVFTCSARHPNYAPRAIGWTRSQGDVYKMLPAAATIKLEKGIAIGGRVVDQRGQPLAGVKVLLSGSDYRGFSMGTSDQKTHEYAEVQHGDTANPPVITDVNGQWRFARFPSELSVVEITLIRPDESKAKFSTSPGFNHINQFAPVALADLRAGKAELALADGITVRGRVTDEAGKLLVGVQIKEGYGHANIERVSEFTTGEDGRFERLNRAPRQWIYTASKPDRATVSVVAQVEPGMAEVRLVLPPAKPLRLRITDPEGKPAPDCSVRLDSYRNEGQLLDWSAITDAEGRATWTNAPMQAVHFYVSSTALGATRKFKALADGAEHVLVLTKTAASRAVVKVRAVDQATRAPVKIRTVAAELNGEFDFKRLAEPTASECQVEIRSADFRAGMGESYKIKVEAEGYEPYVTDFMDVIEGDQQLEAALVRGGAAAGVALLANGQPAAGARIWVQVSPNSGNLFCNAPNRYYGERLLKVPVEADGKYQLPVLANNPPVVFTHPEGIWVATLADLKKHPEVRLDPWGRVEGRLLIAGQPKGGVRVNLTTLAWNSGQAMHLVYSTQSAADGSFVFTNVPAGEYRLYRQVTVRMGRSSTEDHPQPLTIKAGETLKLDYAQTGRVVIGQAQPEPLDLIVDWQNDDHVLILKQPAPRPINREDYASFKAFLEADNQSSHSPERIRQARQARSYVLAFERDGSFRAEDVPPGTYELRIKVTRPDPQSQFWAFERPENQLGSLVREVTIPAGQEPFDLGILTVPIVGKGAGSKAAAAELEVRTLENQPLTLASFQGKMLVLVFWAHWSERSREQLAALQGLQTEFAVQPLAWLNVCMDGDLDKACATVKDKGYKGQQAFAEKSSRTAIAQAFGLETLPAVFLLNEQGRILDRDLTGDRLRSALQRRFNPKQSTQR